MTVRTLAEAKAAARALRTALNALGHGICHGQALDLVARQNGERNWNALHARLCGEEVSAGAAGSAPFHLHQRVRGTYLKQPFTGESVTLSCDDDTRYTLTIRLDAPVDTVAFGSFSNWRRRIRGTVGRDGRSWRKTSDGSPHLVVGP